MIDLRRFLGALLLIGAIVAAGLVATASVGTRRPDGPTSVDPSGAGMSGLLETARSEGLQVHTLVSGLPMLREPGLPGPAILVLGHLTVPLTEAETEDLDAFLAGGGTVWILDAAGHANPWLVGFGAGVSPHPLLDPTSSSGGPANLSARVDRAADLRFQAGTPTSLLLEDGLGWETILVSSPAAHLDLDRNGTIERSDTPGPHVVGARLDLETGGQLLAIADSNPFRNELWSGDNDNRRVAQTLLSDALPDGGALLVDESRQGWFPAERPAVGVVRAVADLNDGDLGPRALRTLPFLVAVALLVASAPRRERFEPHKVSNAFTPPSTDAGQLGASLREVGWLVVATKTNQSVESLKRAGLEAVRSGLASDALARRALDGTLDASRGRDLLATLDPTFGGKNP